MVWSLANSRQSPLFRNEIKQGDTAIAGFVCDIISSKEGLCKYPFYATLHSSVVSMHGPEGSVFSGWHTAMPALLFHRPQVFLGQQASSSSSLCRAQGSLGTARGHVDSVTAQRHQDRPCSAVPASPGWKSTTPGALCHGLTGCSFLPHWVGSFFVS